MGYANFDKGVISAVMPMMKYFTDRRYKVYIIGGGMVLTAIWTVIKAFLPEKTVSKVNFISTAAELLVDIDAD
jgi:hypothetical protein